MQQNLTPAQRKPGALLRYYAAMEGILRGALAQDAACHPKPRAERAFGEGWRGVWDEFRYWLIFAA